MEYLSRAQVREIDRRSIQEYQIPGVVLMENAARAAADLAGRMLSAKNGDALILCGAGNNGGDGLAVARHLHNRGVPVRILFASDPAKYKGDALANWQIVQAMKLTAGPLDPRDLARLHAALIIDAIFGTGLTTAPRPPFAEIVQAVAESGADVLAIDLPSGMDCDTGQPLGACIRATQTITFVAQKLGFKQPAAAAYTGPVTVGDIGCPRELIHSISIASP
jgi:NAD(P)H-hydrate epimerase